MIPHEYIEEVIRRNDILDVVGSYVQLKRKGRLHSGLCPFHSEKTPSFYVYPDTQSFYCFGCGAGGDAITFIKKINNLDYVEAVKLLAARAGMNMPEEDDKVGRMRSRVLAANREAARFFHACLNSTTEEAKQARAYWRGRGLDDKTIVRFGLGYAPNEWRMTYQYLRDKGFTDQELDASGLVKRGAKGNPYDMFRGRVMTPIFDLRGNVIAFGGRVLDDAKPKYINSPETLVYNKSKTLFALNLAKKSASRRYVLCEGYMDVISMQKAGIDTAVCACGTALTAEQVKLLGEYADEVVLCYDSDEAGQKATARSLELFRQSPLKVSVLQIPHAKDPDEYIKRFGKDSFLALLEASGNATEFRLGQLRKKYDLSVTKERLEYVNDALRFLAGGAATPAERDVYIGRIAQETDISRKALEQQLVGEQRKLRSRQRQQRQNALVHQGVADQIKVPYGAGGQKALGVANAEQQLIAAMLRDESLIPQVESRLELEQLVLPEDKEVMQAIFALQQAGVAVNLSTLGQKASEAAVQYASYLLARNSSATFQQQDVELFLDKLAGSVPKSAQAASMNATDIDEYLQNLASRKGAAQVKEE